MGPLSVLPLLLAAIKDEKGLSNRIPNLLHSEAYLMLNLKASLRDSIPPLNFMQDHLLPPNPF